MIIAIIAAVLLLIVLFVAGIYNKLQKLKIRSEKAWRDIDIQLQRRFDLIPNLVNTVKGYAKHEAETLEKVISMRNQFASIAKDNIKEKANLNEEVTKQLRGVMVQLEAYPELKANENFSKLMDELSNTENKISYSRQFYNDATARYNTQIALFPSNIFASMFNFTERQLFEVESQEARQNVKVEF